MSATGGDLVAAAPTSTYACWDTSERRAADAFEARLNQDINRERAARVGEQYVANASDESLARLATIYRRTLEDVEAGLAVGGNRRAESIRAKLSAVETEIDSRAALRDSWLAAELGTHCATSFAARGGLAAVLHHSAPAPSYQLAAELDRRNWMTGRPHALQWDRSEAAGIGVAP